MFINSYLIAFFSGIFIYLIMVIDSIYIEPLPNNKTVSPKIPLLVTLLVWIICSFQEKNIISNLPSINALNQEIFLDPY
jgi:hypothetical protein